MLFNFMVLTVGFFVAGLGASVLGFVEPIWAGKGSMAFVYLLIIFMIGAMGLFVFGTAINEICKRYSLLMVCASFILGILSYPLTNLIAEIVPNFIKTNEALATLGFAGILISEFLISMFFYVIIGFAVKLYLKKTKT